MQLLVQLTVLWLCLLAVRQVDATASDVVKGKTFSSEAAGKMVTGTLVRHPIGQAYKNSTGMTFNLVPAGIFTMGSPITEPGREINEIQHQVTLTKSFYIQITEVTNKHWNTLIVSNFLGVNPSTSHTGDAYPVENVNWFEAASFANWLSYDEGLIPCYNGNGTCSGTLGSDFTCTMVTINATCTGYRLPTEAEWEYAARAGTTTAYANPVSFDGSDTETGDGFNANLAAMGWYDWNNTNSGYADGSKPVAQKQANRWGLYDMHGSVYEWCQDWYSTYSSDPVTDPTGPPSGSKRVNRGDYYYNSASYTRSAFRNRGLPGEGGYWLGFRLVRSLGQ